MKVNSYNLNEIQLDALKEVINIGAGNATTSLSILLNQKIDMSVPNIELKSVNDVIGENAEELVVAVMVKSMGDAPSGNMFVFKKDVAVRLVEILTSSKSNELSELGLSVISEIGNIISSSFINALVSFTQINAIVSVPSVIEDMEGAILVSSFVENGQYDDTLIDIQIDIKGELGSGIEGKFYFIPGPDSLDKILKSLGLS